MGYRDGRVSCATVDIEVNVKIRREYQVWQNF